MESKNYDCFIEVYSNGIETFNSRIDFIELFKFFLGNSKSVGLTTIAVWKIKLKNK